MRILSRYLLRQHVAAFVFALSALTSFMLLNQVAKKFGDLVGKGLPWGVIAEFFVLSVPFLLAMTLPMAVLVAVLFAFSRFAADNEFTAARAGGVSLGQLVLPVFAAAAGVALLAFLFSDHILPRTNHQLRTLQMDIGRKKPTFALKEQVINEVRRGQFFLRTTRIDPATFGLRDVTIYDLSDADRKRIIYADSGEMAFSPDQEDLWLTLYDGTMHEFDRTDPKMFQHMAFHRDVVRVAGVGNELRRTVVDQYKGDREMSVCEMETFIRGARRERAVALRNRQAVEANGLRALAGLVALPADTMVPEERPSLYCRGLARYASWLLPPELTRPPAPTPAPTRPAAKPAGANTVPATPSRVPRSAAPGFMPPLPRRQTQGPRGGAPLPPQLMQRFNAPAQQTLITGVPPATRLNELRALEDRAHTAELRAANYQVEVHKKYAIAVACMVFVLVGVPVALRFPRGGIGLVVGASVGVFAVYYIGLIAGESLANRLYVQPALAMWSSDIIFAALGLTGLWRARTARRAAWPFGHWRRRAPALGMR
jgi:lipopolysaccharide export system permease protein